MTLTAVSPVNINSYRLVRSGKMRERHRKVLDVNEVLDPVVTTSA